MTPGSPLTLREAMRRSHDYELLRATPRSYGRLVMRRISPWLSWFVVRFTPLSADTVTVLGILSGVAAGVLIATANPVALASAIVLLQVAYLFDVADGEVARLRGTTGRRGQYLDLIGHVIENNALYIGAAFLLVRFGDGAPWALFVAFAALAFSSPFGLSVLQHVLGGPGGYNAHGSPERNPVRPVTPLGRAYRRIAFLWNYPAAMNLFCLALLADVLSFRAGFAPWPWATPSLFAVFGASLAAKQIAHAVRLLWAPAWKQP